MTKLTTVMMLLLVCGLSSIGNSAKADADAYNAFFEHMVGEWTTAGPNGNPMTVAYRWVQTQDQKGYIIGEIKTSNGNVVGHMIEGYDASSKSWKRQIFVVNGMRGSVEIQLSEEALQNGPDAAAYAGTSRMVRPSGAVDEGEVKYVSKGDSLEIHPASGNVMTLTRAQ